MQKARNEISRTKPTQCNTKNMSGSFTFVSANIKFQDRYKAILMHSGESQESDANSAVLCSEMSQFTPANTNSTQCQPGY